MNTRIRFILVTLIAFTFLGAGCAPAPQQATGEPPTQYEPVETDAEAVEVTVVAAVTPAPTMAAPQGGGRTLPEIPARPNRLIIKNAELTLRVDDTDTAIDRATQVVADTGGYIISSRVWYQDVRDESYKYATITIGVPVDQFERAMQRLRDIAVQVVDESASGQDVTDEYVDLQSRLDNLEATRDRIREFLEQTQNVEEALRVNEELAAVEEQIEQVQGRMNYLFDRAAYSTITIQLQPDIAPIPTPTPEPGWSPATTVRSAGETLGSILQALAELAIWLGVVVLPLLLPPALIVWAIGRRVVRRGE
jgi:hypothetical protein